MHYGCRLLYRFGDGTAEEVRAAGGSDSEAYRKCVRRLVVRVATRGERFDPGRMDWSRSGSCLLARRKQIKVGQTPGPQSR